MTRPATEPSPQTLAPPPPGSPEWLSAWMDGEADGGDAVAQWRSDPAVRSAWADFHRIGDVLRSDDLAGGTDDAQFLARWRARVGEEPVVLAPQADLAQRAARTRSAGGAPAWAARWGAPAGIAAGVVVVASSLWIWQRPAATQDASLAAAQPPAPVTVNLGSLPPSAQAFAAGGTPDPRNGSLQAVEFEPYLSAHKQFQPANAQGSASGFLRSAVYESR